MGLILTNRFLYHFDEEKVKWLQKKGLEQKESVQSLCLADAKWQNVLPPNWTRGEGHVCCLCEHFDNILDNQNIEK